ncbi:MAG: hypothetical protein GC191_14330 [Azospirillum sp.]|nr:hypothetical protein [Azospirillum sp.]
MRAAAHRHFEAAEHLFDNTYRRDVAGYLFGIAAECALKQMMLASGMHQMPETERRADPFYAHFEELKSLLRDKVSGRLAADLRRYAENSAFMQYWDASMRYSHGKDVNSRWIDCWRQNAKDAIGTMDT